MTSASEGCPLQRGLKHIQLKRRVHCQIKSLHVQRNQFKSLAKQGPMMYNPSGVLYYMRTIYFIHLQQCITYTAIL